MKKLNWWQRLQCKWLCPNFKQDRPAEDKPGKWMAVAVLKMPFSGEREVFTREVEGLFNAYEVARWLALKLDRTAPAVYGVNWGVRKGPTI